MELVGTHKKEVRMKEESKVKKIAITIGKKIAGLGCILAGLYLVGVDFKKFLPEKKYAGGDVSVKLPPSEDDDGK